MEDHLARTLALPAGSRVLDAGCGMGEVATRMARTHGLQVEGVEKVAFHWREGVKRIQARGLSGQVQLQLGDYLQLPFPDQSFDGLYTMETFVHCPDVERGLQEFMRVLRPGGRLVMNEYSRDPDFLMSRRARQALAFVNHHSSMPVFQRFHHGVQERLMLEAGFQNILVQDLSTGVEPMMRLFAGIAWAPYLLVRACGLHAQHVNVVAANEYYRYGRHIRYKTFSANKPG